MDLVVRLLVFIGLCNYCLAHQPGEKVVVRTFSKILTTERTVDEVGPGQILTVLKAESGQLWVSRGTPGWIPESAVMELKAAEPFFNQRFATGAGASDYLARGNVRIAIGKLEEGVADLKRAVELANDKQSYLEALGYGLMGAKDPVPAVEAFTKALALKTSASALMGRGLAYYQLGENAKSETDFTKAIELAPEHAFPRKYYGALLHDVGKLEDARKQLNLAIKLDGFDLFSRKAAARLYYDLFLYEDALKQFDFALTIDKQDVEAIAGRGVVLHAIGTDLPAARAAFEAAIKQSVPNFENAYLWSNLGQVQTELGDFDIALKSLNQAVELDPSFTEARSYRAHLIAIRFSKVPSMLEVAKSDLQMVFKSSDERTFWDYRAAACLNANLGDFDRAAKFQATACNLVKSKGPRRFISEADSALAAYKAKRLK